MILIPETRQGYCAAVFVYMCKIQSWIFSIFISFQIVSLSGEKGEKVEASHLAFDWIGRRLFWEVEYYDREPKFGIMALDLTSVENMKNAQAIEIISSETAIKGLTVNPFTR